MVAGPQLAEPMRREVELALEQGSDLQWAHAVLGSRLMLFTYDWRAAEPPSSGRCRRSDAILAPIRSTGCSLSDNAASTRPSPSPTSGRILIQASARSSRLAGSSTSAGSSRRRPNSWSSSSIIGRDSLGRPSGWPATTRFSAGRNRQSSLRIEHSTRPPGTRSGVAVQAPSSAQRGPLMMPAPFSAASRSSDAKEVTWTRSTWRWFTQASARRRRPLRHLERCAGDGSVQNWIMAPEPFFDELRQEPRFREVLRRLNLPEWTPPTNA